MVNSSFFTDGGIYETGEVTSGDTPGSTTPSQAPSSFYPGGSVYDALADSDEVLAQLQEDLAAAQAAQAAAELAASNSNASAAAAHQAYLDSLAVLASSLLKANNLSDLTSASSARTNIGLGNVDNTSDSNKPVSTAQAAADALKANIASPTFTGTPSAPTATAGTNTTQLATTAFVEAARVILAAATALKAPLASPALTGTPTAPTASAGTNTTQIATTAFVEAARVILAAATSLKADIASPALTGTPTAPTATAGTNTTQLATTAFVLANATGTGAVRYDVAQGLTAAQQKQARANIGSDDLNVLINSDFRINQRAYSSGAALAAGAYGHDRWKAGAAGGDYTFSPLFSSTTVTIATGKTLIQVVDAPNVEGGTYVLSWTGTAQARAGVNSATPSGSYAAGPLVITGQTAGTVMSVEFNAGTLGKVKLEVGSVPTPFVMREYSSELMRCYSYYYRSPNGGTLRGGGLAGGLITTTTGTAAMKFPVTMRSTPTVAFSGNWFVQNVSAAATATLSSSALSDLVWVALSAVSPAGFIGATVLYNGTVTADAEL